MKNKLLLNQIALLGAALVFLAPVIDAQSTSSNSPLSNSIATPRPFDPGTNTTNPSALAVQAQNPYLGSVATRPLTLGVLPLSLTEVVDLGLKANLGLIDTEQEHAQSRAARMRALSVLLPQLNAELIGAFRDFPLNTIGAQKLGLPNMIGNFNYQTADISLQQKVLDISALHEVKASHAEEQVSEASLADARNIVVLASTSAYLQVLASQSRVQEAQAEQASSQALESLLKDRVKREVSPEIDAIRATVTRESAEQRLALAQVRLEKDKLGLTRIIGLPVEQEFTLTTDLGFTKAPQQDLDTLVQEATASRQDLKAAAARVEYSKQLVKAQTAKRLPELEIKANGGETGVNFGHAYGTYEVAGRLSVPIFTGRRIEADVLTAEATLHRREAEYQDLQQRTRYDVRSAVLDLRAADTSVEVAKTNLHLAKEGLRQAKDRFEAGVSNSLELIQAQQAVASAEDNDIASVYAHNLAKLLLVRSTGTAERDYTTYLGVQ
ncbi:TolC family protein [Granulicella tundricola]|uniref:Outer membrane efflux protein n=1 Tax=Granulicella tundricola (strain ATCC BAA-1859 / DSM 23138 / MP5ACTX9) TaxID=1198114 RepID=E8X0T3_GRATM|nr:TolC family protein [Granulicella tundricola]ADW70117.1 outer membrane efflux protein [Granulicella tundricola MP5ACTX9]